MTAPEPESQDPAHAPSAIRACELGLDARWDAIQKAREKTNELNGRLRDALQGLHEPSCSVVVTGSLARGEAGEGSDADWVLLVDGPSDPEHARLAREVSARVRKAGFKDVGPTATFGNIVVSHELVHHIAGTRDTNENLTRRILLLAESKAITNSVVRERVIRNVLSRYVRFDRTVPSRSGKYTKIPYFLLNDVVRYWRTIASDYASKMWERGLVGWATRNIKLRYSRKLIFVWGLLASFSGDLWEGALLDRATTEDESLTLLSEVIRRQTEVSPLDLLAKALLDPGVSPKTALETLTAYDQFLAAINDPDTRKHLDGLEFERAADDEVYTQLRRQSFHFRQGVNALFFDEHPKLPAHIRDYGVF